MEVAKIRVGILMKQHCELEWPCVTKKYSFRTSSKTPYLPYIGGGISGRGEIKMVSASIPSAKEPVPRTSFWST